MKVSDELRQAVAEAMWESGRQWNPTKITFDELVKSPFRSDAAGEHWFVMVDAALTAAIPLILEEAAVRQKVVADMTEIQCQNGNWNCNSYMHGMANGMIYCNSLLEGKEPVYLAAPEIWLDDIVFDGEPIECAQAIRDLKGE